MSRQGAKFDSKKVVLQGTGVGVVRPRSKYYDPIEKFEQNSELVTLTYGALVAQIVKDYENPEDVNRQLDRIGYNMGVRFIEDYLAKSNSGRCLDLRDTADKVQNAFNLYLGIAVGISNWSPAGDEFSITFDSNPLTDLVELPDELRPGLKYCSVLCGAIRGALEMVQLEVQCGIIQDTLKGDATTEIRVKFIRKLEDAVPAGED